jgi:hypothetical protein
MIISHKYKFIFIKTAKTAGTSVEIALSEFLGPDDIITPISAEDEATRQALGFRGPQNTLVPLRRYRLGDWKRLVRTRERLHYFNHMPAERVRHYIGEQTWDDYFVFCFERNPYDKAISRYFWRTKKRAERPSLEDYLRATRPTLISDWHLYTVDGELAVDFVGRYERLEEDLETVRQRLGLPRRLELPRAKGQYRKDRTHYSEFLSPTERALIEQTCAREFAAFGYTFETVQPDAQPEQAK